MSKKVKIDNLDNAIMDILNDYRNACDRNADEAVNVTAKEAVQELRAAHPGGSGQYGSWNAYNKGWTIMQTVRDKRERKGATIHNRDHYQLTHLLEKGHAKVNGGRTRAFPHIAPVAEKCEDKLLQRMIRGL